MFTSLAILKRYIYFCGIESHRDPESKIRLERDSTTPEWSKRQHTISKLEVAYEEFARILPGAAVVEMEKAVLLLLLAAIKCEHREYFIRQIMEELNADVQRGIMQSITYFTDGHDGVQSLAGIHDLNPELELTVTRAISNREELYFRLAEEVILRICDRHPDWTPTKGRYSDGEGPTSSPKEKNGAKRSHSMASLLDLLGGSFKGTCPSSDAGVSDPDTGGRIRHQSGSNLAIREEDTQGDGKKSAAAVVEASDEDKGQHLIDLMEGGSLDRFLASVHNSEQTDELAELHEQLCESQRELSQLRDERARLADAAIRCQELGEEITVLTEECENLKLQVSKENEEGTKLRLLEEKLLEKSKRILDLEWQHDKDLEEIQWMRNELTDLQLKTISSARLQQMSPQSGEGNDEISEINEQLNLLLPDQPAEAGPFSIDLPTPPPPSAIEGDSQITQVGITSRLRSLNMLGIDLVIDFESYERRLNAIEKQLFQSLRLSDQFAGRNLVNAEEQKNSGLSNQEVSCEGNRKLTETLDNVMCHLEKLAMDIAKTSNANRRRELRHELVFFLSYFSSAHANWTF
ncbi:unnamed protein product [Dibothriocephalus latus]|uniref:HOOK N-terminal domain-containing protein n=1 Tax=Dibothriocephalus latus TaxID=60516 RepID=A0A3P6VCK5_DIBLA|nr:unnamed protein product [Dibothriocephalus latus]